MAKVDPKKNKSPAKAKAKSPLKKIKSPKTVTKRVGSSKKAVTKKTIKNVKAKVIKKSPAKKPKLSTKMKKPVVKKKAVVKSKAKTTKKTTPKPRSKSQTKTSKKPMKKDTKMLLKKKTIPSKSKSSATKKKATKIDSKKKPAIKQKAKKVVSTKKKKTPAKKTVVKKPAAKKPKTVKKPNKSVPAKKKSISTKQTLKSKQSPQKQIARSKTGKAATKVVAVKKVTKVSMQKKSRLSVAKLKSNKKSPKDLKQIESSLKVQKRSPKPTKKMESYQKALKKTATKTKVQKMPKKQVLKSKTLTANQKEKMKKIKATKKLKEAKAAATKTKRKGKENKEPAKKRKAVEKESGKAAKKIKLADKEKTKKKQTVGKVQKQKQQRSVQKKKTKEATGKKSTKKLTAGVKKQKKEQKSPLKQNKTALLKQNNAYKPWKETTPKKKKGKSIDDIGNWSPAIPVVSTVSPVWGYTPPGNFGKKSLLVYQDQPGESSKLNNANPSKIKVTSGTSFNIKVPGDESAVWITGMAVFPTGQLIMCDIQNVKLKLFDALSHKLLSFTKTGRLPQDISISALNPADAYFTLNMERTIQKCSIEENNIVLGEKFSVNGCCRGIVCTTNGIITSVENAAFLGYQIQVRDYDGTIMRTISNMQSGLFSHPICFDISSDGNQIVISDCALMSATICLDINGKQMYKFTRIPRQRGITLDEHNNVYLPDHSNTNKLVVMLLSPDGREVKDLITKGTKGVKENLTKPYQIVYHRLKGVPMLFLSVQQNDIMYAFKLSN